MITLPEARELREQLSPAFAGYVTDGNISDRDVLATLMDLIVRGYIGLDAESQKKPAKVRKIYFVKTSDSLLPFEKKFMEVLFKEKKELKTGDVKGIIESKVLHKVIKNSSNELASSKVLKPILLFFNKNKERKRVYYSIGTYRHEIKTVEDLEAYLALTKFKPKTLSFNIFILLLTGCALLFFSDKINSERTLEVFLAFGFATLLFATASWIGYKRALKTKGVLYLEFKGNKKPFMKEAYEELFEFISEYPLKTQRLYNEFMPHSVAFGLDTSWNKSFDILTEPVVISKPMEEIPKHIKEEIERPKVYRKPVIENVEPWKCKSCGAENSTTICWVCGSSFRKSRSKSS